MNSEVNRKLVNKRSRENLYRGKRIDNRHWIEGYYVGAEARCLIIREGIVAGNGDFLSYPDEYSQIAPETLCQYTRLRDIKRQRIFELDIIKVHDYIGIIKFGNYDVYKYGFYVEWITKKASAYNSDLFYWVEGRLCEVIGNIFDNSDSLGGQEE